MGISSSHKVSDNWIDGGILGFTKRSNKILFYLKFACWKSCPRWTWACQSPPTSSWKRGRWRSHPWPLSPHKYSFPRQTPYSLLFYDLSKFHSSRLLFARFSALKSTVQVMLAPGLLNPGCASHQSFPLQRWPTGGLTHPPCVNFPQTDGSRFPLIGFRDTSTILSFWKMSQRLELSGWQWNTVDACWK